MALKLIQGKQLNVNLTGSFTGSFSGSFNGTSSYATQALSASYATQALSASYALSSSYSTNISGTANYISKFTDGNTLGNSVIYNSGNNVGIGTTTPTSRLVVDGDGRFAGGLTIGSGYAFTFADEGTTSYAWIEGSSYDPTYSFMKFVAGGNEAFRITSAGNLGIGTTVPLARLHIIGSGSTSGSLSFLTSNALGTGSFRVYDNGNVSNPGFNPLLDNEAFGKNALESIDPASPGSGGSTAIGPYALRRATTSRVHTAVGYGTMAFTSGSSVTGSIALGYFALANQQSGQYNIGIGYQAMQGSAAVPVTGNSNIGIGAAALFYQQTGSFNIAIGQQALQGVVTAPVTGDRNLAIGATALYKNTSGTRNNAVGDSSLSANTVGSFNTANGNRALQSNTSGSYNSAIGIDALAFQTSASFNTGIGAQSLQDGTLGDSNTGIGYNTGRGITIGRANTIIGAKVTGLASTLSNTIILADGDGNQKFIISSASIATLSGSLNVTNGITGSILGSASYAENAGTASNILGGVATHIPFFNTNTTLATSSMYQSGSSTIIINQDSATTANPEALYVWQPHPTSFNVVSGKGNLNNYLQLNIANTNQGINASSDIVATANNGDETTNYIDMGINSENYNAGFIGNANDAYLYSTGKHLHIGNASNEPVMFFAGGSDVDVHNKLLLNPNNQHEMTGSLEISGSLKVNQGITGSLFGTSSWALNAQTASYAPLYLPLTGGTINGDVTVNGTASIAFLNVQYESASVIYSSGSNVFGDATNDTQTLVGTVLVSGSQQITGSLTVSEGITGYLFGTASYALTSSYSTNISGSTNYISKFTGVNSLGNSLLYDNGTNVGIGTTSPTKKLDVAGDILVNGVNIGLGAGNNDENTIVGFAALTENTTGYALVGFGREVFSQNTTGRRASAFGNYALWKNTTGEANTAIGNYTLPYNESGSDNTAIGTWALYYSTTGSGNISVGKNSGVFTSDSITHLTTVNNSTFLGTGTQALQDNSINEIVIGAETTGNGSNTVTLGNTDITTTILRGNVGIGTVSPTLGTLQVSGNVYATSFTGSFSGSFDGTGSYATQALSASYASTSSYSTNISGSTNYISKFTGVNSLGNSLVYDNGTNVGIGTTTPNAKLDVAGTFANGLGNIASGSYSHAEGSSTEAKGTYSHAEGYNTIALGDSSHAEGDSNTASGYASHAEGNDTRASGDFSHAEGVSTIAQGITSHAEGDNTIATGASAHAEGRFTTASGGHSHAEGYGTVASGSYQHVQGQYNIASSAQSAFIIGNGISDAARSNLVFASGSQVQITGSLVVTQDITGSLFGTSSWAVSASNAVTASFLTSNTNAFIQSGNSFGTTALLGTNDNQALALETSGSERIRITSAGSVGIGTVTPGAPLHVNGNLIAGASTTSGLFFNTANDTLVISNQRAIERSGSGLYYGNANTLLQLRTNSTARLHIDNTGNIGIGTTAPTAKLHIAAPGALSTDIALKVRNSADTGDLMVVNGLGNVNLGAGTLTARLNVTGIFDDLPLKVLRQATYGEIIRIGRNGVSETASINYPNDGVFAINTVSLERIRINSGGNVLINTTTDIASSKLTIESTTQGFLPPRMTTTQRNAIATPAGGLVVYTTDLPNDGLNYYNSGSQIGWHKVLTNTGSQAITGSLTVTQGITVTGSLQVSSSIFQYSNNTAILSGTTANVASFPTSSYMAGFFDFVASSGTNARAGTIFTVWNGSSLEYVETSTNDIGSTTNLILSASLSGANVLLQGTSLSGTWNVKTLTRMI